MTRPTAIACGAGPAPGAFPDCPMCGGTGRIRNLNQILGCALCTVRHERDGLRSLLKPLAVFWRSVVEDAHEERWAGNNLELAVEAGLLVAVPYNPADGEIADAEPGEMVFRPSELARKIEEEVGR